MKVFLRTFNNKINSKTGSALPEGQYRGTPEWIVFQEVLKSCLEDLGYEWYIQPENINIEDAPLPEDMPSIYVHLSKREKPNGTLFWMQMHMSSLFTIDTNGWGVDHSRNDFIPSPSDDWMCEDFCVNLSSKLHSSGESKCKQEDTIDNTPSKFILVPTQIPRDYTIHNHSPITVRYFIDSIVNWADETMNHVCFKLHPHSTNDIDLQMAVDSACASSKYVHRVRGNIHELIKRSSGLFVINSGTGFEGIIHGKPVATFGACDYDKVTFNADIRRLDEARNFIFSYKEEWRRLGYQFIHWYYQKHAYDVYDKGIKSRLTEYLKGVL